MSEALDRLERITSDRIRVTGQDFKDPRKLEAICYTMWVRGQIGALSRGFRIGETVDRLRDNRLGELTVEEVGLGNGVHFTGSHGKSLKEHLFAEFDATAAPGFLFERLTAWFQGLTLSSFFIVHGDENLQISDCFISESKVRLRRQWLTARGEPRAVSIESSTSGEEIVRSGSLRTHQLTILHRARERFGRFLPMIDRRRGETLKNTFG